MSGYPEHRHHPDELTDEQKDRMCPACRMRYRVPPAAWFREEYSRIEAPPQLVTFLKRASAFFDSEADGPYTAQEFVEWMLPDLTGRPTFPEFDGLAIKEGGFTTGSKPTRQAAADPLPYVSLKEAMG